MAPGRLAFHVTASQVTQRQRGWEQELREPENKGAHSTQTPASAHHPLSLTPTSSPLGDLENCPLHKELRAQGHRHEGSTNRNLGELHVTPRATIKNELQVLAGTRTPGERVNRCSHCGNQYEGSSKR